MKRVLTIDYSTGVGTIDSNANATVSSAAVANSNPTWETRWNNKVQTGASSPVGSVAPVAVGQIYRNTSTGTAYMAHGLTDADWTTLN